MSSPFDAGRDSNVGSGNAFGDEPDVDDADAAEFMDFGLASPPNRLGEADYRPSDQHA